MAKNRNRPKGRAPDWTLSVFDKVTEVGNKVGAGWTDPRGHISIKLNLCTVLTPTDTLVITLFPADDAPDYMARRLPKADPPDEKPEGEGDVKSPF